MKTAALIIALGMIASSAIDSYGYIMSSTSMCYEEEATYKYRWVGYRTYPALYT